MGDSFQSSPFQALDPISRYLVHDEGSCSACLSTLLVFLQTYYPQLSQYRLQDEKIHIGIGKHLNHLPEGTILIGNCTSKMKKEGYFCSRVPPCGVRNMEFLVAEEKIFRKHFLDKKI